MAEPKPKDEHHEDEKTPFEKFEEAMKKILSVPKEEVDAAIKREQDERKREREKKQAR